MSVTLFLVIVGDLRGGSVARAWGFVGDYTWIPLVIVFPPNLNAVPRFNIVGGCSVGGGRGCSVGGGRDGGRGCSVGGGRGGGRGCSVGGAIVTMDQHHVVVQLDVSPHFFTLFLGKADARTHAVAPVENDATSILTLLRVTLVQARTD